MVGAMEMLRNGVTAVMDDAFQVPVASVDGIDGIAEDIGRIEAAARADIAMLDLDTVPFTPPKDLRRQLVFREPASAVRMTIVDGRVLYEDERLTHLDEAALRTEARALTDAYRTHFAPAMDEARRLEPHYRDMVLRVHARDVGMRRRLSM
jgi:5-methylthioadenosine/S-adenosylhomocysteine deaminase